MFKPSKKSLHLTPENAPPFPDADADADGYFIAFIRPLTDKFVLVLALLVVGAAAVAEGIALTRLIPLHAPKPYFLDVERDADGQPTSRVERSNRVATEFNPTEANKRYFLKQWLTWTMSISPKLSKDVWLPKASSWTRGKATNQLDDWVINKEKVSERIEREKTLTREVKSVSISFIDSSVAVATVTLVERINGVPKTPYRKIATIEHALVPISEDEEYENPIGLTITGFVVNDDMEK